MRQGSDSSPLESDEVVIRELMSKLPAFDPNWPKEAQVNYLAYAEKVLNYAEEIAVSKTKSIEYETEADEEED